MPATQTWGCEFDSPHKIHAKMFVTSGKQQIKCASTSILSHHNSSNKKKRERERMGNFVNINEICHYNT